MRSLESDDIKLVAALRRIITNKPHVETKNKLKTIKTCGVTLMSNWIKLVGGIWTLIVWHSNIKLKIPKLDVYFRVCGWKQSNIVLSCSKINTHSVLRGTLVVNI